MYQYLVHNYKPSIKQKTILMLHGFGSNKEDLFSFSHFFPNNLLVISAQAPFKLNFDGFAWYDIYIDNFGNKISDNKQANKSLNKLSQFIDYLIGKYNIDPDNFNLLGFSQGAILSYSLAFHFPNKIKNVIALSGYINHEILPATIPQNSNTKFFVSHGKFDEIIPIQQARNSIQFLKKHKIEHDFTEYEMGHEVSRNCLADMINWIENNI
jgi:phospholipase/carboxylesterase